MIHVATFSRHHAPGPLTRPVEEPKRDVENVRREPTDVFVREDVVTDRIDNDSVPERRPGRDHRCDPRSRNTPSAVGGLRKPGIRPSQHVRVDGHADVRVDHGFGGIRSQEPRDHQISLALRDSPLITRSGGTTGFLAEPVGDRSELVRRQVRVEVSHRVVTVLDRDVPLGPLVLSAFCGQVCLDPSDEPLEPGPQLGDGVGLGVLDDAGVETVHGLGPLELADRVPDLPHPRQIDTPLAEGVPRGGRLVADGVGERQPVLHLPLAETHRLTDRQSNRATLDEPLHGRLGLRLDPLELTITELQHHRQLTKLTPRTLTRDVSQDVDRNSCSGGHTSNLNATTDTPFWLRYQPVHNTSGGGSTIVFGP
nr:hypothetical protein [Aeromicrobium fastidiosum]